MHTPRTGRARLRRARRGRSVILAVLAGCSATLALAGPAWADNYGELSRFAINPGTFKLSEATAAFGVNPTDNSIYVGEEAPPNPKTPTEPSGEFRSQRFAVNGTLLFDTKKKQNP